VGVKEMWMREGVGAGKNVVFFALEKGNQQLLWRSLNE